LIKRNKELERCSVEIEEEMQKKGPSLVSRVKKYALAGSSLGGQKKTYIRSTWRVSQQENLMDEQSRKGTRCDTDRERCEGKRFWTKGYGYKAQVNSGCTANRLSENAE